MEEGARCAERRGQGGRRWPLLFLAAALSWPSGVAAQGRGAAADTSGPERHCVAAERFLSGKARMATRTEPDSLDDWRTHRRLPSCRVTAAGVTRAPSEAQARQFFTTLRDAGWTRTPDPRDAPGEASLRFRHGGSDCLFNFYTGGLLGTDAELAVEAEVTPRAGERRYYVLALCLPVMEAAREDRAQASASSPSR